MSNKRIYALTDEQAKWLGYYAKVGGYPSLDDTLTPLNRDAAVDRMAEAMIAASPDRDLITEDEWECYRYEACAALDALLRVLPHQESA